MKSVLFFGVMRGGSSITFQVVQRMLSACGYSYDNVVERAYSQGISLAQFAEADRRMDRENILYGPFRDYPDWLVHLSTTTPISKVMLVRDPRDCLVSHHFVSNGVHSPFVAKEEGGEGLIQLAPSYDDINVHVLVWARYFRLRYEAMVRMCQLDPSIMVFRYEDIYQDFDSWVEYLAVALNLPQTRFLREEIDLIKSTVVLKAQQENASSHHRKGAPYDYLEKLCAEAIDELTHHFSHILSFFGYGQTGSVRHADFMTFKRAVLPAESNDHLKRQIELLMRENGFRIAEIKQIREGIEAASVPSLGNLASGIHNV